MAKITEQPKHEMANGSDLRMFRTEEKNIATNGGKRFPKLQNNLPKFTYEEKN